MTVETIQQQRTEVRRLQRVNQRNGSLLVSVPKSIVNRLGLQPQDFLSFELLDVKGSSVIIAKKLAGVSN